MRKIIATVAAFALVSAYALTPASYAAETTVLNSGDNVNVQNSTTTNTTVTTTTVNSAVVNQTSAINQNSGNNIVDGNIATGSLCDPCAPVVGSGVGLTVGGNTATVDQSATDINSNAVAVSVESGSQAGSSMDIANTGNNLKATSSDTVNLKVNTTAVNTAFVSQSNYVGQNSGFNAVTDNIGSPIGAVVNGNTATVHQTVDNLNSNVVGIAIHAPTSTGHLGCLLCGPCDANVCTGITNTGDEVTVTNKGVTNVNVNTTAINSLWSMQSSTTFQNSGFNAMIDNIGGGLLGVGGNSSSTHQGLSGNDNVLGISIDESMPMGGSLASIVNTGNGLNTITNATDNTTANTTATNLLWGFQAQITNSNSGFSLVVNNIGGGLAAVGGNAGGTTQALSGNNNAALFGNNALSILAMLALLL